MFHPAAANRLSRTVDGLEIDSLFYFLSILGGGCQLWVVGVLDLRARGNSVSQISKSASWESASLQTFFWWGQVLCSTFCHLRVSCRFEVELAACRFGTIFHVGSPLGGLYPLSSPRIKKLSPSSPPTQVPYHTIQPTALACGGRAISLLLPHYPLLSFLLSCPRWVQPLPAIRQEN